MDKKIAFLFPGQGAQYVGMGRSFYDSFSIARETFEEADDRLAFPLSRCIFAGPAADLTLTKNNQVAIYVTSVALWRVVQQEFPDIQPAFTAGLSLGEYTALTASHRLSFADGIALVRARGTYMYEAGLEFPGTMAVALGLSPEKVSSIVQPIDGVWVANINCPGQVVVSGTIEGIAKAQTLLKEGGAKRVLPLDVSGAFHSGLMEGVRERLEERIAAVSLAPSSIQIVMNVRGGVALEEEIRSYLIQQVVAPVYWEKGVRTMEEQGAALFIEMGCGKTLSGMNRKIGVQGKTLSVEKVEDLEVLSRGVVCGTT